MRRAELAFNLPSTLLLGLDQVVHCHARHSRLFFTDGATNNHDATTLHHLIRKSLRTVITNAAAPASIRLQKACCVPFHPVSQQRLAPTDVIYTRVRCSPPRSALFGALLRGYLLLLLVFGMEIDAKLLALGLLAPVASEELLLQRTRELRILCCLRAFALRPGH